MDPIVSATLAWCNDRRIEQDLKPVDDLPKGKRSDAFSCPCGKLTGLYVGHNLWRKPNEPGFHWHELPRDVGLFVQQFDGGHYPQYEE